MHLSILSLSMCVYYDLYGCGMEYLSGRRLVNLIV